MCGIAGYISLTSAPPDLDLVRRMTALLAHRGPDGEGFFADNRIALGHRRLSILDLEKGAQPMSSQSEESVLVHNGEIYNTPTLRGDLARLGLASRTHTDTEVILEGLEAKGESFLVELNGIFAFAWHHLPSGRSLLARDPFGVKPLYYHQSPDRVLFASEIKALLADSSIHPELDRDELTVLLTLRYNPSPGTLLKGILKLPPGYKLMIEGNRVERGRYAPAPRETATRKSFSDWTEEYRRGLEAAVAGQLLSDVPVGAFLSGGIDSTGIACLMAKTSPGFSAFTIGFDDPSTGRFPFDERDPAKRTAERLGLVHQTFSCGPGEFSSRLQDVVRAMEEPVGSASALPYWILARGAATTHKVVLAGQGADEPHGGYRRIQGLIYNGIFGHWVPSAARAALKRLPWGRREELRRGVGLIGRSDPANLLLEIYRHFPREMIRTLVRPAWQGAPELAANRIAAWREPVAHLDPVAQMLAVDTRMSLADDLLLYGDKLSMAHGLEVRVPYLDCGLMRLVESMPSRVRVGLRAPKKLHRAALKEIVPPEVFARAKLGFDTPVDHWFRTRWVEELPRWLWGSESFLPSIFEVPAMQQILEEHRTGRVNHQRRLYTLLALEFWGRSFL